MKKVENMKQVFIESAIHVAARDGLDKTTTKAIAADAGLNEAFMPEANVDMLIHQIFDTMLSFAARVLGGEMPDDDATTQWAFEQIYSFVVPNVREDLFIPAGSVLT